MFETRNKNTPRGEYSVDSPAERRGGTAHFAGFIASGPAGVTE
jgi:hypothetical protein